jgi:hypothetical protein
MTNEIEKLNADLVEARERMRRRERLRTRLSRVEEDLWAERKKLEPLQAAMNREAADVRRLEGLGLAALFYTMLGSKVQQLEKERQQALAAKLKHDEASFAVAALADEERRCAAELEGLGDAEARYQELVEAKEKALRGRGKEFAERLVAMSDRLGAARADLRELDEAHAAGVLARMSLDVVVERLNKAEGWGCWDVWGGGAITTGMKHSHLDAARQEACEAQKHLRTFGRELRDVGVKLEADLQIDGFMKFADWFFDGLLVDWVVQGRIQESLKTAKNAQEQVHRVIENLERRQIETRGRLKHAENDRKDFIEKS